MKSRDLLNKLKWTSSLDDVKIYYIHRGAPDNVRVVSGKDILELGPSFFTLKSGSKIPYHRLIRIEKEGDVLWFK